MSRNFISFFSILRNANLLLEKGFVQINTSNILLRTNMSFQTMCSHRSELQFTLLSTQFSSSGPEVTTPESESYCKNVEHCFLFVFQRYSPMN